MGQNENLTSFSQPGTFQQEGPSLFSFFFSSSNFYLPNLLFGLPKNFSLYTSSFKQRLLLKHPNYE